MITDVKRLRLRQGTKIVGKNSSQQAQNYQLFLKASPFKPASGDISGCGERGLSSAVKCNCYYRGIIRSLAVMSKSRAVLFEIENPVTVRTTNKLA